jgi:hypothetical protein
MREPGAKSGFGVSVDAINMKSALIMRRACRDRIEAALDQRVARLRRGEEADQRLAGVGRFRNRGKAGGVAF